MPAKLGPGEVGSPGTNLHDFVLELSPESVSVFRRFI